MRDVPKVDGLRFPREAAPLVCFAGLILNLDARTLARESGEAIPLTRGEFALLRMFVTRPGRVLSRDTLLDALASRRFEPFDRSVDVLIGRLRRKIEPDPKDPRLIVTVPGEGYRFDGLSKTSQPDQKPSIAVLAPPDDEGRPDRGSGSREPSDQHADPEWPAAETKPAPSAQTKSPASIPGLVPGSNPGAWDRFGFASIAVAIAALLLLAAGGWYILGARGVKPAQAGHLSIVALPFANLSGDPAQDHFADGVTDNLTTELSRIKGSFVIARNTASTYKGKNIDAKEIGRELGVRYVLEGSVQRDQNRVRVNAQLVDTESGAHLWADRFEEDLADLFKLQDEVVTRLARGLGLALIEAEAEKGARSKNPDVIDLTMGGASLLLRSLPQPVEDMRDVNPQARALFDRALQIDPNNADALAGSAATYLRDYVFGWGDPGIDYEDKVLGQANRAIVLDPDKIGAYQVKADYLSMSGRPRAALGVADAGLAANPNSVSLYAPRASAENDLGRFEQAKADVERAIRLSPRDPFLGMFHVILGDAEINLGHFDAAIDAYRKALVSGQRWSSVYLKLSAAYALAGKMDEAKAALAEARRLNPELTVKWMMEHTPSFPAVFDGVRKAGLPEE
jgi:TolB-like protein/DNA-binding winged helix-turn-helix (wHTH) protein/Flp pilus assembly protein TadD